MVLVLSLLYNLISVENGFQNHHDFSNIIEYVNNYVGNQGFPTTHPFNNNEEEPVEDNI